MDGWEAQRAHGEITAFAYTDEYTSESRQRGPPPSSQHIGAPGRKPVKLGVKEQVGEDTGGKKTFFYYTPLDKKPPYM